MTERVGRAAQRARTRARVRDSAQRLFDERGFAAVTVADVARDAGVAVQTVFNHFSGKEELFFDGRTPWVDGPAAAVRGRGPDATPLEALGEHLVAGVRAYTADTSGAERARFMATVEASASLRRYERELTVIAEQRLRDALCEAWSSGAPGGIDAELAASMVAGVWLAATRALMIGGRRIVSGAADAERAAAAVAAIAEAALAVLAGSR